MAKKADKPSTLTFKPSGRRKSLIEWNDPSRQAHVLDWRHRAHEFGLSVDERDEVEEGQPYDIEPRRLVEDEEPEAFARQPVTEDEHGFSTDDEDEQEPSASGIPVGREDIDLVRVYLQHIGRRKLLKAHEEVVIGERIERAQRNLVAALGEIPGAVQTLVAL